MGVLKHKLITALLLAVAALGPWGGSAASQSRLDPNASLERSEAAIGQLVGSYILTDSKGEPLDMASFRGRPLVISLVYTSCSTVCPVTTQHLLEAVREARRVVGEDAFAVLTIGFDARRDTPSQLNNFARTQGIDANDWQLASADLLTIEALLDDLGFSYDAAAGGFDHITQTTILDADGRVFRQVYGDTFPDQIFIEPLKALVFGTTLQSFSLGNLINRIKFICTVYNSSSGAYEFDYAIGFGIVIGGGSLIFSGFVVFYLWRDNRRLLAARNKNKAGEIL